MFYLASLFVLAVPIYILDFIYKKNSNAQLLLVLLMFVPTISALIAAIFTKVKIQFGKFRIKYVLLGLLLPFSVMIGYYVASVFGVLQRASGIAIPSMVLGILSACLLAIGEEIGWRGYLLPNLRKNHGFFKANLILAVVWLIFHIPVILIGTYGESQEPLALQLLFFSLNIFAFSFIVGVIWEYSRDVWMSTAAHGSWNAVVQTTLAAAFLAPSAWLVGEFGFIPFCSLLVVLIVALIVFKKYPPQKAQLGSVTKTKLKTD